jgi:hypothetical protein
MPDGSLIDDDEMFVLTPDVLQRDVPEELAMKRGDMPSPDTLDAPVEVVLDEDKPPVETDEDEGHTDGADGDADTGDGEGELDLDPAAAAAPGTEGEGKKTPKDVPYGRLADKVAENQALKDEIARLKAAPAAAAPVVPALPAFDLDAKYKEYADLVSDGETEEATKVMREIDNFKDMQAEAKLITIVERRESRGRAQVIVNELLTEQKDFFADQDNVDIFDGAKNALLAKGYSLDKALAAVSKRFFGEKKPAVVEQTQEEKDKAAADQAKIDADKAKVDAIKEDQRKKTVVAGGKAAAQQPSPVNSGRSARATPTAKPNALTLTEVERKSMSEKEKRKARGDFV